MTWVIGKPTIFGHGLLVSDIAVKNTATGRVINCLQKVYPVGNFVAAGFAGSVELGFKMLDDLARWLSQATGDKMCSPKVVAFEWYRRARRLYNKSSDELKKLGCQIMLVGVCPILDPSKQIFPEIVAISFKSPEFQPEFANSSVISIGSGASKYYDALLQIEKDWSKFGKMFEIQTGQLGIIYSDYVARSIKNDPTIDISEALHVCVVKMGQVQVSYTEDFEVTDSNSILKHRPPKILSGWEEFNRFFKSLNDEAAMYSC